MFPLTGEDIPYYLVKMFMIQNRCPHARRTKKLAHCMRAISHIQHKLRSKEYGTGLYSTVEYGVEDRQAS